MNFAYVLNAAPSSCFSNWKLPNKWIRRNEIRNKPVSAIQYFFPIEDLSKTDLAIVYIFELNDKFNHNTKLEVKTSYLETFFIELK